MRAVCVVAVVCAAGVAAADSARARQYFEKATTAYNLQDFPTAMKLFKQAYEERQDPVLLYNIGQCQRQLGDYDAAARSYRAYLNQRPDAPNRVAVARQIEAMDQAARAERAKEPPTGTQPPTANEPTPAVAPTPAPEAATTARAPERPVYKKPWFWAVVVGGAAVVATGIALGVVFGGSTKNPTPSMGVATATGF